MDPEKDEEFWLKLIDEFDNDGDGKISFEEFESNMIGMVEDSQNRRQGGNNNSNDNNNPHINVEIFSEVDR